MSGPNDTPDPHVYESTKPIRVLIVDDSAVYRQMVGGVLKSFDDVEVVGIAKDGVEALRQIADLQPDVITLDVEMPNLNGIETLKTLKRRGPRPAAIMVSSLTEVGAAVTMEALFEGAFDFITKPTGGLQAARQTLHRELREKFDAWLNGPGRFGETPGRTVPNRLPPQRGDKTVPCELVLIGVSTGGPQALRHVVPKIDADLAAAVIVVQHMPAGYTTAMAERLDELSEITVHEAADATELNVGSVTIAPGGRHLRLVRQQDRIMTMLNDQPSENGCRPAVDYTLRSAIEAHGDRVLTVIMTGMGKDGLLECERLKRVGGTVFCQDAATAAVFGMPKAIIDADLADRVLPLGKIGAAINRHVRHTHAGQPASRGRP